jgi:hypothetical protein
MRFSTYRTAYWVSVPIIGLVAGLFGLTISTVLGVLLGVIIVLLGAGLGWAYFGMMQDRLDEYGGEIPMPGWWGVAGVDIVDDARYKTDPLRPASSFDNSSETKADDVLSGFVRCPVCGALHSRPSESAVCVECGAMLTPSTVAQP